MGKNGRTFGTVWVEGEDLGKAVVAAGWARVKPESMSRDGASPDYEELVEMEGQARAAGRGMHTHAPGAAEASMRHPQWDPHEPARLFETLVGVPQRAIVEHVRDGASLRIYLPDHDTYLNLNLAGAQCPRVNARRASAEGGDAEAQPEPYAEEARFFTEMRLLHRRVIVHVEGMGKTGGFFGSVEHPNGNIAAELLRHGLARGVQWSGKLTSADNQIKLREALQRGREARLNLWKDWTPPSEAAAAAASEAHHGTIGQVLSGDVVVFLEGPADAAPGTRVPRRLYLSSVRAPRLGHIPTGSPDEPWAHAAREFLRKLLIGRRVSVTRDYTRQPRPPAGAVEGKEKEKEDAKDERPARVFGTVIVDEGPHKGCNAAEELVLRGLAEVTRHRDDDTERSPHYEALVAAELRAQKGKRGVHGDPKAKEAQFRCLDLIGNPARARQLLPHLQRAGEQPAVVEHVFAGSRAKLYLPRENCMVMFALAGVRCPSPAKPARSGRPATNAEPFANDALLLVKERALQREVVVDVETMDQHGTALGALFLGGGAKSGGTNLAVALLREGLARVNDRAAERHRYRDELYEAQEEAQEARRRVWERFDEEQAEKARAQSSEAEAATMRPCNILSGGRFMFHVVGEEGRREEVQGRMRAFTLQHGNHVPVAQGGAAVLTPRRNLVCAALFDVDKGDPAWHRARVVDCDREAAKTRDGAATVTVQLLDHGIEEEVPAARLRPLDSELASVPPLARECVAAFVRVPPPTSEVGLAAAETAYDLVWGNEVSVDVHGRDEHNRLRVTVHLPDGSNLFETLLRRGLARISKSQIRTAQAKPYAEALRKAQQEARRDRLGLFQFGDPDDSDNLD